MIIKVKYGDEGPVRYIGDVHRVTAWKERLDYYRHGSLVEDTVNLGERFDGGWQVTEIFLTTDGYMGMHEILKEEDVEVNQGHESSIWPPEKE